MHRRTILTGAAAAASLGALPARAQQASRPEIQFWFGLAGALGERVQEQVQRFNASQDRVRVVATYKGSYTEVLTGAIADKFDRLDKARIELRAESKAHHKECKYDEAYEVAVRVRRLIGDQMKVSQ